MAEAQKTSMENTDTGTENKTGFETNRDSDVTDQLTKAAKGDTEAAKEVFSQAKEKATEAVSQTYNQVTEKATEKINEQKGTLAQGLSSLAENLRQMDENLRSDEKVPLAGATAKYGDTLANQVQQVADYLERKDVRAMMSDVEDFARRNPAIFIGGAFVAGLLVARFLKSSSSNTGSGRYLSGKTETSSSKETNLNTGSQTNFNTGVTGTTGKTGTTGTTRDIT